MKKATEDALPIKINKGHPAPTLPAFTDHFQGFENVEAVRRVFGDRTEEVLSRLRIGFISNRWMYMGIRDHDGNLAVGTYHLKNSDDHVLYLDIVHELFHIRQWMEDKDWFTKEHQKFMGNFDLYWVSPIEVPAYRHAVKEAERLGMPREELVEYLKMGPPTKVWERFIDELKLEKEGSRKEFERATKGLPVRFNRKPALALHPFTDYFQGFEKMPAVREVYGGKTAEALRRLKVEFMDAPFGSIYPSDDDGHLVINASYFKAADPRSVYLDVLLCFNLLKRLDGSASAGEFGESPGLLQSYRAMVKEARRLGASDAEIKRHLALPRFMMSSKEYSKLVKALGLSSKPRTKTRA